MSPSDHVTLADTRIAVVGAGRLGTAMAAALRSEGLDIAGPLGRDVAVPSSDVVVLCVPDGEIAAAAAAVPAGPLVGHTSGATTLAPLAPHEAFSLHPLLSVTPSGASFTGASCAVAGATERAREMATELARVLGMRPFVVADYNRALYHASASMAANYLVTVLGTAEQLAAVAGVQREHLVPLVRSAVENWARVGASQALTGPVARGDSATVARQRDAVAARAPEVIPLWDALTEATRALARAPVLG